MSKILTHQKIELNRDCLFVIEELANEWNWNGYIRLVSQSTTSVLELSIEGFLKIDTIGTMMTVNSLLYISVLQQRNLFRTLRSTISLLSDIMRVGLSN
jgi:hypothetical protein